MRYNREKHVFKWELEKRADRRTEVSRSGFYLTAQWKKLRRYILSNDPLCVMCKAKRYFKRATVVDHIVPLTMDNKQELGYRLDNLQPLCFKCHAVKTARSTGKYAPSNLSKGRAVQDKLNDFNHD